MNLTDQEIEKFNQLYDLACEKQDGLLLLDGGEYTELTSEERCRLEEAISFFKEALQIYAEHFPCLFFLGKIYQRLKNYEVALVCMEEAMQYEQENPHLPQEAALLAQHLGESDKVLEYSEESVRRAPDHSAILGNHSLNLLILGKDNEAIELIERALSFNPDDQINQNIKNMITDVMNGTKERPTFETVSRD